MKNLTLNIDVGELFTVIHGCRCVTHPRDSRINHGIRINNILRSHNSPSNEFTFYRSSWQFIYSKSASDGIIENDSPRNMGVGKSVGFTFQDDNVEMKNNFVNCG